MDHPQSQRRRNCGASRRWLGLLASAHSFAALHTLAGGAPAVGFDAERLIADATHLAGAPPDLVAIDMPLMDEMITARRVSDKAISAAYGARAAGTHSPSARAFPASHQVEPPPPCAPRLSRLPPS